MAISLQNLHTSSAKWPMILSLYGVGGVGKTTFAASAPNPVFIQTEDGTPEGVSFETFGVLESFDDVMDALIAVCDQQHDFGTLVIDSLDRFERLIWKQVCHENGWSDIETPGFGKGYVAADDLWNKYLAGIREVRNSRKMHIIQIVHESNDRFDSPMLGSVSKYGFNLHKRASALIRAECDAIGFMDYLAQIKETDVGFNRKSRHAEGGGQRVLYMEERPSFIAKNRYKMPPTIPLPAGTGFEVLEKYGPKKPAKKTKTNGAAKTNGAGVSANATAQ